MIVMLGSHAVNHRINGFREKPVDYDVLLPVSEINNFLSRWEKIISCVPSSGSKYHAVVIEHGKKIHIEMEMLGGRPSAEILYNYVLNDNETDIIDDILYPSLNFLFMLKMSHRYKKNSIHFEKTRSDILRMREYGGTITDKLYPVLRAREKDTYINKKFSLNKKKDEFFVDNVPYLYDHDTIHLAVARGSRPAYMEFQKPDQEVMCSKLMFDALPFEQRLNAVLEEAYVLALERAIIPHNTDPQKAYGIALRAICTGTTSGWFREFAWENYQTALDMYDDEFVHKFTLALKDGKIAPYDLPRHE